jgi:hypothetical protein
MSDTFVVRSSTSTSTIIDSYRLIERSGNFTLSLSTNIGNPPSLKLTCDNMLFWKALIYPPLRCVGAFGLLNGSDAAPAKMLEALGDAIKKVSMPNPDYAT